jgi:hypothetical protein
VLEIDPFGGILFPKANKLLIKHLLFTLRRRILKLFLLLSFDFAEIFFFGVDQVLVLDGCLLFETRWGGVLSRH